MTDDRTILAQLLDTACLWLNRYVVLSEDQAVACALWAAHTHVFDAFRHTPYLSVSSVAKRSGKTRLLETLRPLVANPLAADGVTPAALVRVVDERKPTLLLDEADGSFGGSKELAEALRQILNSGWSSRGTFLKVAGEGKNMAVQEFRTYCPKCISGIGRLPDTVADRSIPIRLQRRKASESVAEFFEEDWEFQALPIADGFRDALAPEAERFATATPTRPEGLSDRGKDAWRALLAVADVAGGEWPEKAHNAARALCGDKDIEDEEIQVRLLGDVRAAFEDQDRDRLMTSELIDYLHGREDAPWSDWSRGNPIKPRKVADLLRGFAIRPKDIRFDSGVHKGYSLDACRDAFERWLPQHGAAIRNIRDNGSGKPETEGSQSATQPPLSRIENGQKSHGQADVAHVADRDAGTGENGVAMATSEEEEKAAQLLGVSLTDDGDGL